jgi:exopolysaccharide biosynthesis polyprenyl glycosylphosphotransferase
VGAEEHDMAETTTAHNHHLHRRPRASLIRWTHGLINRSVMISDGALILAGGGVAWLAIPEGPPPLTWLQALTVALVIMISFIWTMRWCGNYRVERYSLIGRPLFDLICGFVPAAVAGGVILAAFVPHAWERRLWLLAWLFAIFAALLFGRQLDRLLLRIVDREALLRRRLIVVGSGPVCDTIVAQLRRPENAQNYHLAGVFDPHFNRSWNADGNASPDPARIPDLTRYAQNYAVDLVVIALSWDRSAEIFDLIRALQWIAADVVVPFEAGGFRPQFVRPMAFIKSPVLQVMHRPFKGTQGLVKIVEDYTVALIALLLTAPIMLAASIAIRLDDGSPILFRQPRTGFNSKPFLIYKFRTMTVDVADDGSAGTKRDNRRITRIGRFLRRTSIDELPQLFNVLRGEMSIVGPRPHVANMRVGEGVYSDVVLQYAARHRIKPGITGWAQTNGMRGGIDSMEKANLGAELDLYYIANWSLRLDIRIMLITVVRGLVGRNVF